MMNVTERYEGVIRWFGANDPEPRTELAYDSTFHLLLAVILSAQCTDKRVNMITPALFKAYPTPQALAEATEDEVHSYIKSVSYPNAKTRHLIKAAQVLVEKFGGEVPSTMEELLQLPGVGRKTANVMLAVVWDESAMPVDTHVFRVSNRIGLTRASRTPLATERTLMKYVPQEIVGKAHHWLVLHGRYVCTARKPDCTSCGLKDYCKAFQDASAKGLTVEAAEKKKRKPAKKKPDVAKQKKDSSS